MTLTKKSLSLTCVGLLALATTSAHATSMTFYLDGGGGAFPNLSDPGYATITLTDNGLTGSAEAVTVSETLTSAGTGEVYADTGAGDSLSFNISSVAGTVSITGLTSGFFNSGADTANPFGSFLESVDCYNNKEAMAASTSPYCQGGDALNPNGSGPLSFTVSGTNGVSIADFIANGDGALFASDLFIGNATTGSGKTGVVAGGTPGTPPPSPVPEPSSLLLLGTGILGTAGLIRLRAHQ